MFHKNNSSSIPAMHNCHQIHLIQQIYYVKLNYIIHIIFIECHNIHLLQTAETFHMKIRHIVNDVEFVDANQ